MGEPPGHDFVGSDAFRLPQAWFQAVREEETVLYWATQEQRLQLWSNAAYVLVDVPRGKRLSAALQARNEADRYCRSARLLRSAGEAAPLAPLYPPLHTRLDPPLVRWLKPALPCIERRLRLALSPAADLVSELLTVSGRLYVTATHVDLVTDLESISIPVRWAGLDRNPGWVAGLGRVVSFHFD